MNEELDGVQVVALVNDVRRMLIERTETLGEAATVTALLMLSFAIELSQCKSPLCPTVHGTPEVEYGRLMRLAIEEGENLGLTLIRESQRARH